MEEFANPEISKQHGVNADIPNVQPYTYYFSWLFGT